MINPLLKFEPIVRLADTYWPSVARTQVTIRRLPERNVDDIFFVNASLVFATRKIGVSTSQWVRCLASFGNQDLETERILEFGRDSRILGYKSICDNIVVNPTLVKRYK